RDATNSNELSALLSNVLLDLAEARAQIEELVEANQQLRGELGEMTLLWVNARAASSARSPVPVTTTRQAVKTLRQSPTQQAFDF
ncbi:MAG: hypothetical protein JWL98_268, partial [Xanthomonadaceae bacterium]|nr:hypothetical protein [Xanthomonadaceae bacterium]